MIKPSKSCAVLCRSLFFLALTVLISFSGQNAFGEENLLFNASFEEIDSDGLPKSWLPDAYYQDEGYSLFSVTEEENAPDGRRVACIQNIAANDARFLQVVEVEPETLYRLSGYIRAEGVEQGRGANLSVEGLYVFSESLTDTGGDWRYIEWYGETGEDQTILTLFVRLGGYSGVSTGKAWFDKLELVPVDEVPGDAVAALWYMEEPPVYGDEESETDTATTAENAAWPHLILISLFYLLVSVLLLSLYSRRATSASQKNTSVPGTLLLGCFLLLAFAVRLMIAARSPGYKVDVDCFRAWGQTMAEYGPTGFYTHTGFCDYPPLYTWALGLSHLLVSWIGEGSTALERILFRFIPCLCDVGVCWMMAQFAKRRFPGISEGQRNLLALLLAFNPAMILNSAAWGQMDSVLCLCVLTVVYFALNGKWEFALPTYMASVLVKPQALMFGFLGLAAVLLVWLREKESRRRILIGLAAAAVTAFVIILPFGWNQSFGWLIRLYGETLGSYSHATVNAANFYYLFNGNWKSIGEAAPLAVPLILAVLSLAYGGGWFFRRRKTLRGWFVEPGFACAGALWFVFCAARSESWGMIGTGAMVLIFLIVLSLYIRRASIDFLPMCGALLFLLLYAFGLKMHERYLFPALVLLGMAWLIHRDWRILLVLLFSSVTLFLNEGIVLDNCVRLGAEMGHLNNDTRVLADILAVINVLSALFALYTAAFCLNGKEAKETEGKTREPMWLREMSGDDRLHWRRIDTLVLCGILAVYSVLSLVTLGSTKAPQTAWTSTDFNETVTFDLGETHPDFSMLYFARVSRYNFSVSVSDDGEIWSDEIWAEMNQGSCWKWKYLTESYGEEEDLQFTDEPLTLSGRYIRLTSHQIGLALCEVLFRDGEGRVLAASVTDRSGANSESPLYSDPLSLVDEPDSLEGLPLWFSPGEEEKTLRVAQPSWWNSTYFDEIYHARTAWEFLTGAAPYETTHPPLGKLLMSWSVALFGMTPFGWRFAGAVAGIAMLAGMYLLGKQLTKSSLTGALMGGLMALDCMHLTQTQIATIDSFPVVFIIFSCFFMLRFLQNDLSTAGKKRVLTNLGLSGLFMGLGIASKWIGIYAGAGLAVLFFTHCTVFLLRNRRLRKEAKRTEIRSRMNLNKKKKTSASPVPASQRPSIEEKDALSRVLTLCLWCILFFVLVPIVIYLLSYIPYFAHRKITGLGEYLQAVWEAQLGMFNYHSEPGLGMDHPFYSPWYQWPVMAKPMYYASKNYFYSTRLSYSIFCFGNPVIWFTAIGTMILCAFAWIHDRLNAMDAQPSPDGSVLPVRAELSVFFLLVSFGAQFLPWMLVPRGTYIYHYFASVPFLILSIAMVLHRIRQANRIWGIILCVTVLALAAAAFILFFPYAAGIAAPTDWLNIGKRYLNIWY